MWDNTTAYDELNGQTIYQVLSADKNAWKGDSEQAKFLAKKLGETKQAVSPILAWNWNEGVVAWGGSNPAAAEGYNGYTNQESFRFLYGLSANEDGSAADESTTFSNVYAVFGIDVIGGKAIEPTPIPDPEPNPDPTPTPDPTPAPNPAPAGDMTQTAAQQTSGQQASGAALQQTGDATPFVAVAAVAVVAFATAVFAASRRQKKAYGAHRRMK